MPSDIFIKTASGWASGLAKKIFIKTASSTWSAAKSVWLFFDAGWTRVWPLSGVYATRNPFVSTTSSSSELSSSTILRVGTTYRGNRGSWNPNGYTISSYQYKWVSYTYEDPNDRTTNYDPAMSTLSGTTNDFLITGTNYDKGWIVFFVTAKASGGTPYDGSAESFRYYVVRQRPRLVVNTTPSFNITSPKIGNTISYSSSWDTTDAYKPEAIRTTIVWYKNSTATTTGGTLVQTGGYSYVVKSTDSGSYIYAVETSFNSGSDYDLGSTVGISATAITSSAVTAAIAAPTISSITVSGIGGPVSVSFAGGSGPFYQMFWWGTATAPTGLTTPDASGSASPLTDNTGPTSTATQYMYVRSVTTQSDTGVANATTISPWSAGVSFNMNSASALTPTFGTNTSTANGFTGSVTNYNSAYNWNTPSNNSFTLTNGTWTWGTASGSTRPFTVTGLSASQSSTATVTTTRTDYASGSADTTGTASALVTPTITIAANSGVSATAGTINWTSTNQVSFSSTGTFSATGTTATSITKASLTASTTYTGTITVTSSTGHTASANYSLTTSAPPTWTITWDAAGGGEGTQFTTQNTGLSHTAPDPGPRGGFDFSYWRYPASGGTDPVFVSIEGSYTPIANVTFGAIWATKTYSVSYNANGGTGAPASQTKTHGVTLTLSSTAPTRATVGSTQYTFAGWNTAADGTGTSYSAGATYTLNAPLSLFAQWTVTTLNWSISWNANGGTGGGTTTEPRGNSHTAPSPGTRSGFTFSQWRKPESGGDPTFVANSGTFTPTANDSFWAQWTTNPVTPTITMAANSGVSATAGTINWTSTNQASFSSSGTFSGTGTTGTSISKTGLAASTAYTGTVTVTSSTGHTASANYSLTTSAAPAAPVVWGAMTAPTFDRLNSSSRLRWGWNNQTPSSGDYTASNITWEWQYSSSNSTTTQSASPTGLIASGTRPNRSGGGLTVGSSTFNNRVSSLSGDYGTGNVAGTNEPVSFNTASRYLRYRAVVVGTNGTTYRSNYSAWV